MTSMTPPKPACRRGDVVLVIFPHADLSGAKLRPALVVQADDLGTDLPQFIVAMITARMFRAGHPSRVVVVRDSPVGRGTGLLSDSVIMSDNLATVSGSAIDRVIGCFPMTDVDQALRRTLALG